MQIFKGKLSPAQVAVARVGHDLSTSLSVTTDSYSTALGPAAENNQNKHMLVIY